MDNIRRIIVQTLERSVGLMFIVITGIILAQVFCRYVLVFSLAWSHEVVMLLFIWTVWLCIPIGLDREDHLHISILIDTFSVSNRRRLTWLSWSLTLFFFVLLFFLTFPVLEAFEGIYMTSIPIPTRVRFVAAIVGSLLSIFILTARQFPPREKE